MILQSCDLRDWPLPRSGDRPPVTWPLRYLTKEWALKQRPPLYSTWILGTIWVRYSLVGNRQSILFPERNGNKYTNLRADLAQGISTSAVISTVLTLWPPWCSCSDQFSKFLWPRQCLLRYSMIPYSLLSITLWLIIQGGKCLFHWIYLLGCSYMPRSGAWQLVGNHDMVILVRILCKYTYTDYLAWCDDQYENRSRKNT